MASDCYEKGHTPGTSTGDAYNGSYTFCRKCGLTIHRAVVNEATNWHTQAELDRLWQGVDRRAK